MQLVTPVNLDVVVRVLISSSDLQKLPSLLRSAVDHLLPAAVTAVSYHSLTSLNYYDLSVTAYAYHFFDSFHRQTFCWKKEIFSWNRP